MPRLNILNDSATDHSDAPGEVGLVCWQDFEFNETFPFESGGSIPGLRLRYETYGRLKSDRSNAILICHALTGDHHCAGIHQLSDRKPGWWNRVVGPGKPIDTDRFFVICSNCLGGCQGSTGPSSINPTNGEPFGVDFPELTIGDMVRAQRLLIEHLEIPALHAVIGGSMGGMQALEWGRRYPNMVRRMLPMATTARQGAQAIAFDAVGRAAILRDPAWHGGRYPQGEGPDTGLAVARMMAHITYLSNSSLDKKFGRERHDREPTDPFDTQFQIESYLHYQGESFVSRFDANTYLYFSKALDLFDLYGPENRLEDALEPVSANTLVIAFSSDWLYPPSQNRAIVHALLRLRKRASYAELPLEHGHDSFLVPSGELGQLIRDFLAF